MRGRIYMSHGGTWHNKKRSNKALNSLVFIGIIGALVLCFAL